MSFARSLKSKAETIWEEGYRHPFVQEIGQGTLDKEKFKFYLLQDYLYLLQYTKVFALAVARSDGEATMLQLTAMQQGMLDELSVHRHYMAGFGIAPEEVTAVKASLFNRTYTSNMIATAQTGDLAETFAAVLPCPWTYYDYAKRLKEEYSSNLENNFYRTWIETYADADFEGTFAWFYDALDALVETKTESQRKRVEDAFISSVEFEYLFWDMAYKKEMSHRL
ncbi:MAG: thiaminase II [Propionibacteriaceae bacterium]